MSSGFKRKISRRDILGFSVVLAGGAGLGLVGSHVVRRLRQPHVSVAVMRADSYEKDLSETLRDALRLYPQFSSSVRGKRVVLKPNLVEHHSNRAVTTHPKLVAAAVETFRSLGAGEVVVAEGPGHRRDTEFMLEESGLASALQSVKAKFIDLNLDPIEPVRLSANITGLGQLWLPRTILAADIIVSMPKMKTHHWVGATLSMKNMFGVVPGAKYGWPKNLLHWHGIDESILDINLAVRPAFAIVDGIEAMEGDGPIYGNTIKPGVLVLGESACAVDATAARIMGIRPGHLRYLYKMLDYGGTIHEGRIAQLGEPIDRVRRDFQLLDAFQHLRKPIPLLDFAAGV